MNPGPVEEAGKAAGTFMAIMKDQPLSLALVIMNLCLLALFYYIASTISERRANEFEKVMAQQDKINTLLYNCVPTVPQQRGEFKLQSDESHPVKLPEK